MLKIIFTALFFFFILSNNYAQQNKSSKTKKPKPAAPKEKNWREKYNEEKLKKANEEAEYWNKENSPEALKAREEEKKKKQQQEDRKNFLTDSLKPFIYIKDIEISKSLGETNLFTKDELTNFVKKEMQSIFDKRKIIGDYEGNIAINSSQDIMKRYGNSYLFEKLADYEKETIIKNAANFYYKFLMVTEITVINKQENKNAYINMVVALPVKVVPISHIIKNITNSKNLKKDILAALHFLCIKAFWTISIHNEQMTKDDYYMSDSDIEKYMIKNDEKKNLDGIDKIIDKEEQNINDEFGEKYDAEEKQKNAAAKLKKELADIFGDTDNTQSRLDEAKTAEAKKEILNEKLSEAKQSYEDNKKYYADEKKAKVEEGIENKKNDPSFNEADFKKENAAREANQDLQLKLRALAIKALEQGNMTPTEAAVKTLLGDSLYRRYKIIKNKTGESLFSILNSEANGQKFEVDPNEEIIDFKENKKDTKNDNGNLAGQPRPDLTKPFSTLPKSEKEFFENIAKQENTTAEAIFEDIKIQAYFLWFCSNTPIPFSKVIGTDFIVLTKVANKRKTSAKVLYDSILSHKEIIINDVQRKMLGEKFAADAQDLKEKFNPGMIVLESQNEGANGVDFKYVSNSCGRYAIIGGEMNFTFEGGFDNELGKATQKGGLKATIIGANYAKVNGFYHEVVTTVIGSILKKDAELNTESPISLTSSPNGYYEIHLQKNKAIMLTNDNSTIPPTVDAPSFFNFDDLFARKIQVKLDCDRKVRVFNVSYSKTLTNKDALTAEDVNAPDAIKDILQAAAKIIKAFKGDFKATYTWNFNVQVISPTIGKIRQMELNKNGKVVKDQTLNNAPVVKPKPTKKTKK